MILFEIPKEKMYCKSSVGELMALQQMNARAGANRIRQYSEKHILGAEPVPIAAKRPVAQSHEYKFHICKIKATELALPRITVHTTALIMITIYWLA